MTSHTTSTRDRLARLTLFAIGVLAIVAGTLGLFGFSRLERGSAIVVGIGAIAGGISMVRRSRGPNPRLGSSGSATLGDRGRA